MGLHLFSRLKWGFCQGAWTGVQCSSPEVRRLRRPWQDIMGLLGVAWFMLVYLVYLRLNQIIKSRDQNWSQAATRITRSWGKLQRIVYSEEVMSKLHENHGREDGRQSDISRPRISIKNACLNCCQGVICVFLRFDTYCPFHTVRDYTAINS